MRTTYLITGIAGSGKSTIKIELAKRGYTTFDVDDGFAEWVNRETLEPTTARSSLLPMSVGHDWSIKEDSLYQLLNKDGQKILCGSAHNLYRYADQFTKIFLLQYPTAQDIKKRLNSRAGNDYGKHPDELSTILSYWKSYEQKYIQRNAILLNCMMDMNETIKIITDNID